jgi:Tetratricopeptide repeat
MPEQLTETRTTKELAKASHKAHRYLEAVGLYQRAMRENPLDVDLWLRCGQAAADGGQLDLALPLLTTYARMSSNDANAHFSLAYALFRAARLDDAAAAYRRAIAVDPAHASALCALGQIAYLQGDAEGGRAAHDAALALPTTKPLDRFTTSVIRLLRGDYERGWADHEARWDVWQLAQSPWRMPGWRVWDGGDLDGADLHVHFEDGFGDTLMIARYLPLLRGRGGRVHVHAQTALAPLLAGMADEISGPIPRGAENPPNSVHCGSISLPYFLGTRLDTIPSPGGYLAAAPSAPDRRALGPLRVGLVWAGNRNVVHDFDRSTPRLDVLAPLLQVPGVEWTSLQVGPREPEAEGSPLQAPAKLESYMDTARVICGLDLVISVDTSVAHLAGAMGCPVWTMVPTAPEFRWLLDRDDSPWYRSMRIFRRTRSDAWTPMAESMAGALADRRDQVAAGA